MVINGAQTQRTQKVCSDELAFLFNFKWGLHVTDPSIVSLRPDPVPNQYKPPGKAQTVSQIPLATGGQWVQYDAPIRRPLG